MIHTHALARASRDQYRHPNDPAYEDGYNELLDAQTEELLEMKAGELLDMHMPSDLQKQLTEAIDAVIEHVTDKLIRNYTRCGEPYEH